MIKTCEDLLTKNFAYDAEVLIEKLSEGINDSPENE